MVGVARAPSAACPCDAPPPPCTVHTTARGTGASDCYEYDAVSSSSDIQSCTKILTVHADYPSKPAQNPFLQGRPRGDGTRAHMWYCLQT
jgi:hypothetical protein